MSDGGGKLRVGRILFLIAALWFYFASYFFFLRNGQLLGGIIFLAAGTWFLIRGLRWRR